MPLSKQKIGNILYWVSLGMLLGPVPVLLSQGDIKAPMSDTDAAIWSIWMAAAVATQVVSCILTGEAGIRTMVVKKEENPTLFNVVIGFYCLIAVILLIRGFINPFGA